MEISLYQSASAMNTLEKMQNMVSMNIASADASGYKQQIPGIEAKGLGAVAKTQGSSFEDYMEASFPKVNAKSNMMDGALRQTGKPTDFALQGEGFFEVLAPNGETILTRDSHYKVSAEGFLVNNQGFPLSGGGGPISVQNNGQPIIVSRDGSITQGDAQVGKIGVVKVGNPGVLQPVNGGFRLAGGAQSEVVENPTMMQGFAEGSNVSSIREMIQMIQISKSYEQNAKVIDTIDKRMDMAIKTLGNTK